MNNRRSDKGERQEVEAERSSALDSGVLPRGMLEEMEREPPWSVVREYLLRGEHAAWVEAHAARSPAFADVLEAMRNDQDERSARKRPRAVGPRR